MRAASDAAPVAIEPEPPEEIRGALVHLLVRELDSQPTPNRWWLHGLRENVDLDDDTVS